jgi:hypothetical protein
MAVIRGRMSICKCALASLVCTKQNLPSYSVCSGGGHGGLLPAATVFPDQLAAVLSYSKAASVCVEVGATTVVESPHQWHVSRSVWYRQG